MFIVLFNCSNCVFPYRHIFVVDVSGSMGGFPLQVSRKLMRNLLGNLRPSDKFNMLFFASSSKIYAAESVYAEKEEINNALTFLDNRASGGGTRLLAALN